MSNVIISDSGRLDTKEIVVVDGKIKIKPKKKEKDKKYICSKCTKSFGSSWLLNRHLNKKLSCKTKTDEDIREQLFKRYESIYEIFQNEWELFLQLPKIYQDRERNTMMRYIYMVEHEIEKIRCFIDNDKYQQALNELENHKTLLE